MQITVQLPRVHSHDVVGMLGHRLFQKLKNAGDNRVAFVPRESPLDNRFDRHQDGTSRYLGALVLFLMLYRRHATLLTSLSGQM